MCPKLFKTSFVLQYFRQNLKTLLSSTLNDGIFVLNIVGVPNLINYFISMRVLPHQQNTGGFFVAVLQKTASLPWEASAKSVKLEPKAEDDEAADVAETVDESAAKSTTESGLRSPARKKRKIRGFKEEPYFFFQPNEDIWPSLKY